MSNQYRTVTCYIDKSDYELFHSIANMSDVSRTAIFAGEMLVKGIQQRADEMRTGNEELSPEARLRLLDYETRQKIANQETLNAIASRGIDERQSDELGRLAVELDLNEEEAAEFAENSPFASSVAYTNNGTISGRCQRWLANVLTDKQDGIVGTVIIAAGAQNGFSESMIKRSSRKIGITKLKGQGGHWYWFPPQDDDSD